MNTTVNELKELYESLGGTPSDVADITTIPDMIAALAEVAGTTIELPAVSSTDNGDVLTVVSGKWAKADPPKELPASATSGQVLTYNDGAWGAANAPSKAKVFTGITEQTSKSGAPFDLLSITLDDEDGFFTAFENGDIIYLSISLNMSPAPPSLPVYTIPVNGFFVSGFNNSGLVCMHNPTNNEAAIYYLMISKSARTVKIGSRLFSVSPIS